MVVFITTYSNNEGEHGVYIRTNVSATRAMQLARDDVADSMEEGNDDSVRTVVEHYPTFINKYSATISIVNNGNIHDVFEEYTITSVEVTD